jgi:hypothetical protein
MPTVARTVPGPPVVEGCILLTAVLPKVSGEHLAAASSGPHNAQVRMLAATAKRRKTVLLLRSSTTKRDPQGGPRLHSILRLQSRPTAAQHHGISHLGHCVAQNGPMFSPLPQTPGTMPAARVFLSTFLDPLFQEPCSRTSVCSIQAAARAVIQPAVRLSANGRPISPAAAP